MSATTRSKAKKAAPAAEESWADKIARLRARKPAEGFLTIPDLDALTEVGAARDRQTAARREARTRIPDAGAMSTEEIIAFLDDDEQVQAATLELEEAMEAATAAEITFHFRALPPDVYAQLELDHPPTDDQEGTYNPDTYIPALIAASSVNPLTEADVAGLIAPDDDGHAPLNAGDVAALFQTCRDLNERPRMILGKGSRPTQD